MDFLDYIIKVREIRSVAELGETRGSDDAEDFVVGFLLYFGEQLHGQEEGGVRCYRLRRSRQEPGCELIADRTVSAPPEQRN